MVAFVVVLDVVVGAVLGVAVGVVLGALHDKLSGSTHEYPEGVALRRQSWCPPHSPSHGSGGEILRDCLLLLLKL